MMKQPIQSGKLTKKFLMGGLPAGVYLANGVGLMPGQPCFADRIVPGPRLDHQWRRIANARVNGRAWNVFQSGPTSSNSANVNPVYFWNVQTVEAFKEFRNIIFHQHLWQA
jgi:hypothetical protein